MRFETSTNSRKNSNVVLKDSSKNSKQRAESCGVLQNFHADEFQFAKILPREKGKNLLWPLQYSQRIFKIVLHHTAETGVANGRTPVEVMRAIYAYHARTKKLGDIGYHFVIDPFGQIYEGKYGGDFVVGGHAFCNNIGTIGIALMGNFQTQNPTPAQIQNLQKLLRNLAKKYEIDLNANEIFHGKNLPNLIGHRDLSPTACPGENFYQKLPQIRGFLAGTEENKFVASQKYSVEIVGKISKIKMAAGKTKTLKLQFKNTGNFNWDRSTWLYVFHGENPVAEVVPAVLKRKYIAAKIQKPTPPGETATFEIKLKSDFIGGFSTLKFAPVVKSKKINSGAIILPIEVESPNFDAQFQNWKFLPEKPFADDRISMVVNLKNTGDAVWKKDLISLQISRGRLFEKIEIAPRENVAPNSTAKFVFSLPPFFASGRQALIFNLLLRGEPIAGASVFVKILEIENKNFRGKSLQLSPQIFQKNSEKFELNFLNSSDFEWTRDEVKLQIYGRNLNETINFTAEKVTPRRRAVFKFSLPKNFTADTFFAFLKGRGETFAKVIFNREKKVSVIPEISEGNYPESLNFEIQKNENLRRDLKFQN